MLIKIGFSDCGELYCGFLHYDALYPGNWEADFRGNMLLPPSEYKMEAVCYFEMRIRLHDIISQRSKYIFGVVLKYRCNGRFFPSAIHEGMGIVDVKHCSFIISACVWKWVNSAMCRPFYGLLNQSDTLQIKYQAGWIFLILLY
jgi:hypothetical protein